MGMDVMGVDPITESGAYFRNNVWWWRPLWNYCIEVAPDLCAEVNGHTNDGDGLDGVDALVLARVLRSEIESGNTQKYQDEYNAEVASMPRRDCVHCGATGIRTDEVGVSMGQPTRALSPEVAILVGRDTGWCNGCDGVGTQEAWEASYPFNVENVAEFAEFLEGCGGFEIC